MSPMNTPTREQVIEWAREADIIDFRDEADDPHVKQMVDMLMHAVNRAHTAGREQGLREAKEVCEQNAKRWPDLRCFYVANECAAAIEQLRGK